MGKGHFSNFTQLNKDEESIQDNHLNSDLLQRETKIKNADSKSLKIVKPSVKRSYFRIVFHATLYWAPSLKSVRKRQKDKFKRRTKVLMSAERLKDEQTRREFALDRIRAAMASYVFRFPDTEETILYRRVQEYWKVGRGMQS